MSENVNNRDFYRQIAFFLDKSQFARIRNGMESEIKKRRVEIEQQIKNADADIKEMEKQLAQVNYNLSNATKIDANGIQLVSTDFISLKEAIGIQRSISKDFSDVVYVCIRESKCGFVNLCNKKIAAPPGSYYAFGNKWHVIMEQIYDHNEDATRFHMETSEEVTDYCSFCSNPRTYDRDYKLSKRFNFWAPKLHKTYPGAPWKLGYLCIQSCYSCAEKTEKRLAECNAYVQKAYNESMNYPKDLILLLCAHARDQGSVLHADNLPSDIFKLILRFVFPPVFLTIK